LLDVILCNDPFIISDVTFSTPFSVSDHCAVNFKFHGSTRSTTLPAHELRDFLMLIGTVFVNSYHTVIGILYSVTAFLVKILYLYFMLNLMRLLLLSFYSKSLNQQLALINFLIHTIFESSTEPRLQNGVALSNSKP